MIRVAVLIPCNNEEVAIGRVVAGFRAALPDATVFVYDNNSTDGTVASARAAGAVVRSETLQGKGNVVRRMFADVEADVYLLVDGDDTYDPAAPPAMLRLLLDGPLDMVTAARVTEVQAAYRAGHRAGNLVLTGIVALLFGNRVSDMLSGYRAFSRRFVKSFPALSAGFETETEFTVHALELAMPVGELPSAYKDRPARLGVQAADLYRRPADPAHDRPAAQGAEAAAILHAVGAGLLALAALVLGIPVIAQFMKTGLVPRLPTAVLATGADGARLPVHHLRLHPRFRGARAQGGQAHGLPRHPLAGQPGGREHADQIGCLEQNRVTGVKCPRSAPT